MWISALGNHQQLPPFPAKDNLREMPEFLNGAFVPVNGTGVREALDEPVSGLVADGGQDQLVVDHRTGRRWPGSPSCAVSGSYNKSFIACFITWPFTIEIDVVKGIPLGQI